RPVAPQSQPSGVPAAAPGRVVFALLIDGTPPAGEAYQLQFQVPHAGQTQFELCGAANACAAGRTYTRTFASLPAGMAPYAFQRVVGSQVTTIASGQANMGQGQVVTATANG
ncbi:MAG: hypothetical protein WAM30_19060, partial [Candidatus Dormiibacterota bacterium]